MQLSYVKSIDTVDSYSLDIEAIYRRHSMEEMTIPVICWSITYGTFLSENETTYFLAPVEMAHCWLYGLQMVSTIT